MKVYDPGHVYGLAIPKPDQNGITDEIILQFVKRTGPGYPGNNSRHPGTIMQEVLRALIDRTKYVDAQEPCQENLIAIVMMEEALMQFEKRTARKRGYEISKNRSLVVAAKPCPTCLHVGCQLH